uniref:Unannotated protein n=1 Tax=freshwater metagenome TaxID=449393 RepID=A0A6J5ZY72_9ZZZZ
MSLGRATWGIVVLVCLIGALLLLLSGYQGYAALSVAVAFAAALNLRSPA